MWRLPGWDTTDKRERQQLDSFFESTTGLFFTSVMPAPLFRYLLLPFQDRGSASSCTSLTTPVGLVCLLMIDSLTL